MASTAGPGTGWLVIVGGGLSSVNIHAPSMPPSPAPAPAPLMLSASSASEAGPTRTAASDKTAIASEKSDRLMLPLA